MTKNSTITALAPSPLPFDRAWSQATLAGILSTDRAERVRRRRVRRRALVGMAAGFLTLSTATAVAVGGPADVVKRVLTEFGEQPNTTVDHTGVLHDPQLVATFRSGSGIFAFWVATSSTDQVCYARSDGLWDGEGSPTKDQLDAYGCGGQIYVGPGRAPQELTRPDQLGGFFKDDGRPMVYGISAFPDAVTVRVQGVGVDRTLPVSPDSHGYGDALPGATGASALTLTFVDAEGRVLGSKEVTAPVG